MGVRMRFTRVSTGKPGDPSMMDVSPTPKGSTREIGSGTTNTGDYTGIVSYIVPEGNEFALSKILVAWEGEDEQDIVVIVGGETVGEYFSTSYVMDWFPPGVNLVGDGTSKVEIEAKAIAGTPTLIGFIEGELT